MTANMFAVWRRMGLVLVEPRATMGEVVGAPRPWLTALALAIPVVAFGVATLPRQLPLLDAAFPVGGIAPMDSVALMMRDGLTRLIIADRIVPGPTLLIGALLTAIAADPVLVLSRARRPALWSVVLLGLTPLALARGGELALTWLTRFDARLPPGEILMLPHRFRMGPAIFWGAGSPPAWLERLDSVMNLMTLWTIALWAVGLRALDGERPFAAWYLGLPFACVAAAAVVTWLLAPAVLAAVLGTP